MNRNEHVMGSVILSFYDPATSLLIESVDAVGTVTTNTYDGYENLIATATLDASGVILSSNTFTYDANNNRTNSTVWRQVAGVSGWVAATTAYIYDAQNRVIQTINPDGGTNTVAYNATGQQQATTDPLGHTTSYLYDAQGRLTNTTFPDGSYSSYASDPNGNRTNTVDQLGRMTSYIYDALNRLLQTVYPDGTTNATVYDDVGRVAQTIDARGTTNAFGYDVASQRITVTNAWGTPATNISFYAFDANGNQIASSDALGHVTRIVFDALNRQAQVQYADSTMTGTAYDAAGRRVAETNQDGVVTLFGYDGAGRLTSVTNALGTTSQIVTRYGYDQAGNQTNQVDALGRSTLFAYDSMGRRTSRTMPGGQTETFGYDLAGNALHHTNFNGAVITNVYDVMNRLAARVYPDGTINAFTYTLTSQRQTMNDPSGSYAYSYDSRDRLVLYTTPVATLNYAYDANGNVMNVTSSTTNGTLVTYQYDALNRLTNVIDGRLTGAQNTAYGFDPIGSLLVLRYPSGVTNLYQHDALNRLTNLLWKLNTTTLASFYYQLGLTGNRTNLTETVAGTNRSYAWRFDSLYRLTSESITGTDITGSLGYGLDAVGNRSSRSGSLGALGTQTFNYNTNDWISTDKYDSNGNTVTNDSNQPYVYDYENRLVNFNNGAAIIIYDGDGNRVMKITTSATNLYLVDTRNPSGYAQVLEEYTVSSGSTNLSRAYTYGLSLISQRLPGVATNFYGTDGHGSARFLLNPAGTVTDTYAYDAYGNLVASTGNTSNNYLYCGEQYDPDLGSYYFRGRTYNPNTGRFPTMDTFEGFQSDPASLHKYFYAAADPVNKLDPSGLDSIEGLMVDLSISAALDQMPSVAPSVKKSLMCGPDVTKPVAATLNDIQKVFWTWKYLPALKSCMSIANLPWAATAWDIHKVNDLGQVNSPSAFSFLPPAVQGGGRCSQTVAYKGKCYYSSAVNYLAYGKMNMLCQARFRVAIPSPGTTINYWGLPITLARVSGWKTKYLWDQVGQALDFTTTGYTGFGPLGGGCKNCLVTPGNVAGDTQFQWTWRPTH